MTVQFGIYLIFSLIPVHTDGDQWDSYATNDTVTTSAERHVVPTPGQIQQVGVAAPTEEEMRAYVESLGCYPPEVVAAYPGLVTDQKRTCDAAERPENLVPVVADVVSRYELRTLPIAPSVALVQPATWWFVNKDMVVSTSVDKQYLTTSVLGYPVEIELTPVSFRWDFGDGTKLTTTDAGAPWPDKRVTHAYGQAGTFATTVTTTWSGRFRIVGYTGWQPVLGSATTTSAPQSRDIYEVTPHLVSGPES